MNTITGLSFYDSLNKLTVGWLALLPFMMDASEAFKNPLAYVAAFLIGIIYQNLIQCMTKPLRNMLCLIRKKNKYVSEDKKDRITEDDYYKAYYKVAKAGILMNIPVLEAIENFIRNIIPLAIFYIVGLTSGCQAMMKLLNGIGDTCHCAVVLTAIVISLVPIWYCVQNKIFKLVWEGEHYLNEIEK